MTTWNKFLRELGKCFKESFFKSKKFWVTLAKVLKELGNSFRRSWKKVFRRIWEKFLGKHGNFFFAK